ncbi:MAG TPA: hypothetical protein VFX30_04380, partial [bacterium]|nr:hypothetical protein [bacterium]
GDGAVLEGEACDDGNAADSDGCSSACAVEDGFTCEGSPSVCTPEGGATGGTATGGGTAGTATGGGDSGGGCSLIR